MIGASFRPVLSAGIALATIFVCTTPASAQPDSRWTLSLGVGAVDRFTYRTISSEFFDYSEGFGFAGLAVAGAGYRLADHATLRADAGYLAYHKSIWGDESSLTAEIPFLATGVRLYADGPNSPRPRFYVEAMPALWVSHWQEHYVPTHAFDVVSPPIFVHNSAFTSLDPGLAVGAGFLGPLAGPLKLDVGVRYLFSTAPGTHHLGDVSSGEFKGLRQFALVLSLHRTI